MPADLVPILAQRGAPDFESERAEQILLVRCLRSDTCRDVRGSQVRSRTQGAIDLPPAVSPLLHAITTRSDAGQCVVQGDVERRREGEVHQPQTGSEMEEAERALSGIVR